MFARKLIAAVTAAAFLAGCATQGANVTASYVPQSVYDGATCAALARDMVEIQQQAAALSGQLDTAAGKDAALVAVGLILFWPALFFIGSDKSKEAELARMKGSHEAMARTFKAKGCERT